MPRRLHGLASDCSSSPVLPGHGGVESQQRASTCNNETSLSSNYERWRGTCEDQSHLTFSLRLRTSLRAKLLAADCCSRVPAKDNLGCSTFIREARDEPLQLSMRGLTGCCILHSDSCGGSYITSPCLEPTFASPDRVHSPSCMGPAASCRWQSLVLPADLPRARKWCGKAGRLYMNEIDGGDQRSPP